MAANGSAKREQLALQDIVELAEFETPPSLAT